MKYIGSGLWALAAAYLEVSGFGFVALFFGAFAMLMGILGSDDKSVNITVQQAKQGARDE
jgi:hypothetical protein